MIAVRERTVVLRVANVPRRWEVIGGLCLLNGWRHGAELGVSTGRFTTFLCGIALDMHMLAVDLWAPQPSNNVRTGAQTYAGWPFDEALEKFKAHNERWYPDRVKIMRMRTSEAAKLVEDGSLDFVFIDADHSYEGALADILDWTPKVRPGGMVSGHDYNWSTVRQAVDETGHCKTGHDNVWWRINA